MNIFSKNNSAVQNIDLVYLAGDKLPDIVRISNSKPVFPKNTAPVVRESGTEDKKAPLAAKKYENPDISPKNEAKKPEEAAFKENVGKNTAEIKGSDPEAQPKIVDIGSRKGIVYEEYFRSIRDKIKTIIEKNKRGRFGKNDIYVKFIVNKSGALKDISLYKSSGPNSRLLEEVAIRSIREAAPFLPFGEGIKENELSLNLKILFQPN
ncbi:MAG: hypothetical protein V1883_01820 [Candidatus Omnitrophota bacterium]